MRILTLLLMAALVLTPAILAQGKVAPPHLTPFAAAPEFDASKVPGSTFSQIHMIPTPGTPGQWIVVGREYRHFCFVRLPEREICASFVGRFIHRCKNRVKIHLV